jgi:hypothetical protein
MIAILASLSQRPFVGLDALVAAIVGCEGIGNDFEQDDWVQKYVGCLETQPTTIFGSVNNPGADPLAFITSARGVQTARGFENG